MDCMGVEHNEDKTHVRACTAYRDSIERREEPVPLSSLSHPELLDMFPATVSVSIRLSDRMASEDERAQNYAAAVAQPEEMALSMQKEIGSNLNPDASVFSDVQAFRPENRKTTVHYLRGEYTEIRSIDFEHAVFPSYVGKFW